MPGPVNFDKFVAGLVSSREFWVFVVEGDDWQFVLGRIAQEFFADDIAKGEMKNFGTIFPSDGSFPVCWARRAKLPVEVVATRFGLTIPAVRKAKMIHLRPLPEPPVKPTVDYYGEA